MGRLNGRLAAATATVQHQLINDADDPDPDADALMSSSGAENGVGKGLGNLLNSISIIRSATAFS